MPSSRFFRIALVLGLLTAIGPFAIDMYRALEQHGAIAGTASALMGTLQMLSGALAMSVIGLFADGRPLPVVADGRPLPMVAGMAGGVLAALLLTGLTLGLRRASR